MSDDVNDVTVEGSAEAANGPPQEPATEQKANPEREARLLDLNGVLRRIPVARSTIYAWIGLGVFPPGRRFGARRRLWTEDEINRFVCGRCPSLKAGAT
jgi:predicted DNA-binding transcriptional regulator AlpA